MQIFFSGWHMVNNATSGPSHFDYCCLSVNRLLKRKSAFAVKNWLLDSGAFTRISRQYGYKNHLSTLRYASLIWRWKDNGNLMAAVSQDYMVEPLVLKNTGLDVTTHQRLTIHRYDRLLSLLQGSGVYLMPVLQGWTPEDYLRHLHHYGDRIKENAWVGVGSICKRQGNPNAIANILKAILAVRPDLRLHGFGVKKTALQYPPVWLSLYSADSQAHGLAKGRGKNKYVNANDPSVALEYAKSIKPNRFYQLSLF
jgi:hypothetical protein